MAMMTFSCASLSSTFSLFKRNRFVSCYFWAAALISPFTAVTSFASSTTTTTSASVPVRNSFLLKSRGGGGEADSSCGLHQQRVPSTLFSPRQTAALTTSALRQSTAASTEVTPTAEHTMDAATKLSALRKSMRELDLDVYLVPTDDPHLSGKFRVWIGMTTKAEEIASFSSCIASCHL